jgi:polysaccharide export outer membrane protein
MYFPYIGQIHVAGMTMDQVRTALTDKLAKYIQKAQLDVTVAAFRSQMAHVIGEVQGPGMIPITDVPLTALEAVNLAKGFTQEADPADVTLVRKGLAHHLDLLALYENGDLSQNWLLQDGDVLHVGDRSHAKIFVLGEVKKPATQFMYKNRMTLAEALGGAEGVDNLTSNPGRIYVIRGTFDKPEVFKLDASSPDALLLAVSFQLKPMDVVFVSTSALTRFDRVMSQLTPTIQALYQAAYTAQTVHVLSQ